MDSIVTCPPVTNRGENAERRLSTDRNGRPRVRTTSAYSEHCEALWEILPPGAELIVVSPSSWLTSDTYLLFRERLRAQTDVTQVQRWSNWRTLWGRTAQMIETSAWRAVRRHADERVERSAHESPLAVRTHGDQERYTEWSHTASPGAKWGTRGQGKKLDWSLTTAEDHAGRAAGRRRRRVTISAPRAAAAPAGADEPGPARPANRQRQTARTRQPRRNPKPTMTPRRGPHRPQNGRRGRGTRGRTEAMSLYATYRSRAFDAEAVQRPETGPMVQARIACLIAGPTALAEDRDDLTEWVNVIAFDKQPRKALAAVKRGDPVAVMGSVTASYCRTRNHERRYARTPIADAIMAMPRTERGGRAAAATYTETGDALADIADGMIGDVTRPKDAGGTPDLDD